MKRKNVFPYLFLLLPFFVGLSSWKCSKTYSLPPLSPANIPATSTFTSTRTFTITSTPTMTGTLVPTSTFTPTSTLTLSPTITFTPTITSTRTWTPTKTATPTPPCSPSQVITIPDAALRLGIANQLVSQGVIPNNTTPLTCADLAALTALNDQNAGIADLSGLQYCVNLNSLNLYGNNVTDLTPLANVTSLIYLVLNNNTSLSNLAPLAGLTNLTQLALAFCAISDLTPLAGLVKMQYINLSWDPLVTDLSPLVNMTQMLSIAADNTNISSLAPIAGMTQMQQLQFKSTLVSDISPLAGLTKIFYLDMGNTTVSDISVLSANKNLQSFAANGTPVSDLSSLAGDPVLKGVDVSNTQVTDLSPLPVANLQSLAINGDPGITNFNLISGMTNLLSLYMEGDGLSDVSFALGLSKLKFWYFGNNLVTDLSGLVVDTSLATNHTVVQVTGNPLSATAVNVQIPALDNAGAIVYN